jgi:hypothetical protein
VTERKSPAPTELLLSSSIKKGRQDGIGRCAPTGRQRWYSQVPSTARLGPALDKLLREQQT